jgi:hypothetical protein
MDWIPIADEKLRRYADGQTRELDERALVRQGNLAYAAAEAFLMARRPEAVDWFRRAAADWRRSWDLGEGREAWGRPIGALKASLLAGDALAVDELARWALELGTVEAESPVGRYAGTLALLALGRWADARLAASSLRGRDDFPPGVADALSCIAAHDVVGTEAAIESVVTSFETRDEYLEDMAVADTALVLQLLAARREIEVDLRASPVLPAS